MACFGNLGVDSVKMLEYSASIPQTEEIRPQYNPATYMLEIMGADIGRDGTTLYQLLMGCVKKVTPTSVLSKTLWISSALSTGTGSDVCQTRVFYRERTSNYPSNTVHRFARWGLALGCAACLKQI
ncbi:hypothetical protein F441_00074 [Phytophthora nicotianae CJ01A1]|uniref:Uncharacterized protein n=5 Tax=Phytophthora nicotianae TaxID=4792 RepID=V9G351_PHYNI|nr:hypothetical protein F443_00077 [Phytophthora nicotianae P1569]ETK97364.1 hypothetical protein L915_00075 [Phytophthora nicotianae]ETO86386.1 hypothetical protein F444_00072 [Phytophthora nicotianae P1976]ETP27457.1 hypothetical protein F441_00074 [Phytophthora nicotianae CJ01A1]ETP55384.1 hypothetical protein F442_00066 [Phytophthora nicotianae P10297]